MLFTKIFAFASAVVAAAAAATPIQQPPTNLNAEPPTPEHLPDLVQGLTYHGLNSKRQQSNRDKLQKEIDAVIADYRAKHEADHGRRLAGCPSSRCTVCAVGLTVAYVSGLTFCGATALTEEAVSAGTLTPLALTQLGACVTLAHATYAGGWAFCIGMKD